LHDVDTHYYYAAVPLVIIFTKPVITLQTFTALCNVITMENTIMKISLRHFRKSPSCSNISAIGKIIKIFQFNPV